VLKPAGFPHSDISGSQPVSGSPELIAAVHVLLRLWLPRHPPYALRNLTLSLRHASSSRAGFDLRKVESSSRPSFVSFRFATLGRYDLLEMSDDTSFEVTFRFSIFNEQGRVTRLVRPAVADRTETLWS
jgi:hypothetical protein